MRYQSRRDFLRAVAGAGVGVHVLRGQEVEEPAVIVRRGEPPPRAIPTTWIGAMTSTTATVKAKLPSGVPARVLIRERADATQLIVSEAVAPDGTTVATFGVRGLRPATHYTYTLEVEGRRSYYPPGELRTFPEDGKAASFAFAFGSCARTGSEHEVFETIRRKQPAVFLHLGDFYYENFSRPDPRLFRAAWDTVLSSRTQGALYREVPLAYVWDDHDFGPNDSDWRSPARAVARSVYRQYAPHYELPSGPEDAAIYQAFSLGRARFVLTDLRSERVPRKDGDAFGTLMSEGQRAWLKRELLEASLTHRVVFWASSVPWLSDVGSDTWAGYEEERREIANFVAENRIRNLCILCGDAHMLAADDGKSTSYAEREERGIPVLHGSPFDQGGSYKGGPYSHGYYVPGEGEGCFGWVEVRDEDGPLVVDYTGRSHTDRVRVALRFEVA